MPEGRQAGSEHRKTDAGLRPGCLPAAVVTALLLLLVTVGGFSLWILQQALALSYESRIYPNVHVMGQDLGGLTPDEAAQRLDIVFRDRDPGHLILTDGHRVWQLPWTEAGMGLDPHSTAQQAFATGRHQGRRTFLSMWLGERREVSPVFTIDTETTRRALEGLADQMREPPMDAALELERDQLVVTPSQEGHELDIDSTAQKIVDTVTHMGPNYPFAPTFRTIPPRIADVSETHALAEEMLCREIQVVARGEHEGQSVTWSWTLGRDVIAGWLLIEEGEGAEGRPGFFVGVNEPAVRATVEGLAAEPTADDWGFPTDTVAQQVLDTFRAGGGEVAVALTPPPRIYIVQPGDQLSIIAARFGMPPGLIAEVNPGINLNLLQIGQQLIIPAQDILTPYETVPGKKIVISIARQRLRVYENDHLLYDWPCSTGKRDSPTYTGTFQVLGKQEMAYASQWDLQMPHFISVYRAGGDTYNGIHALPFLSSGERLWEGNLGSPVSYGCIILGVEEGETLYNWAERGVPVIIE